MAHYDTIVIGAGLAGLAAAIRTAHFGKSVRVFEAHTAIGGLNSWYKRNGHVIDVGLHALTNFVPESDRSAPLNRILRQLRIKRSELALCPQDHSEIAFPGNTLRLNNDFAAFRQQIAEQFPEDIAGFDALVETVRAHGYSGEALPYCSTLEKLVEFIKNRRLRDMLCMPVMYYGNPREVDMDFQAFCTMFQSVLIEGFARPQRGMQHFLHVLQAHLEQECATLSLGCGVKHIEVANGRVSGVIDASGESHTADTFVAAIGARELSRLIGEESLTPEMPLYAAVHAANYEPQHSFIEGVFELPRPVREYGLTASATFLCAADHFDYRCPAHANACGWPFEHILICAPGNYPGCEAEESILRLSAMTPAQFWIDSALSRDAYGEQKRAAAAALKALLATRYAQLANDARYIDLFTPRTIARYTAQTCGCIYGGCQKLKDFQTGYDNMLIAGTDQGLLGIVGAMLSGIIAANTLMS